METPAQYSVKKSYTFGPVVRKDTFVFLSNSENGQRKDDLMHAFPNTTFEHNHAPVRIIRRNLMVVFSSRRTPSQSSG